MKKLILLLAITIVSTFISCDSKKDKSTAISEGTITIGDEQISLRTGRSIYYGIDAAYNTDLFISTLSQADIEALSNIELSEGVFNGLEEYEAAYKKILGDKRVGTFYIEAFSDIMKKIAIAVKEQSDNLNPFVDTDAQFSYGDDLYNLEGKLKVVQSSKNHYELEFHGATTDGTEVDLNFDGDFVYENNILGIKSSSKAE